jgi:hypothetical protein
MILYKYRSLANLDHVLDIILNQRLHCSIYLELNDPFEGIFETTTHPYYGMWGTNPARRRALVELRSKTYKKAKDLLGGEIDKVKICSLSSDLNDVRLWSYYADGHKGIVFEIDFSGLETNIHEVKYDKKLPTCGRRSILLMEPHDLFSHKTEHWEFESEYRIIHESKYLEEGKYFDIKGRIKAIYLGTRTNDVHRKLLNKIVPSEIPIYTTKINEKTVEVERGECVPERKTSP